MESLIETLECGCERSVVDGFRYTCCEKHADLNPCLPYWPPDVQAACRERAKRARSETG
jgi:hypothetical protein